MDIFSKNRKNDANKKPFISRFFRAWAFLLLAAAVTVTTVTAMMTRFDKVNHDDLVIVLDPGHGGSDVGASNTALGLYESEINLKIALACRDKLQQYDGVRVYMTHTKWQSPPSAAASVWPVKWARIFSSACTSIPPKARTRPARRSTFP